MGSMTDKTIKAWIKRGERFDLRTDGDGLCLSYREKFAYPVWKLRYMFSGKQRVMTIGSYRDLSLASARAKAAQLRAEIKLGCDVAIAKQERIRAAVQAEVAKEHEWTMNRLADEYLARMVDGKLKHPDIPRRQIDKDIRPRLGKLLVKDVHPMDVDDVLNTVMDRGAPTIANDVLRLMKKLFDYAVTRHVIIHNPAAAFGNDSAGGVEHQRDRALSRTEITAFFEAMRNTQGFSIQNYHTFKLLLLLAVRKQELTTARVEEFDLDSGLWMLPANRTKTGVGISIPLSESAVDSLRELIRLGCSSRYLLPARKAQDRMLPHIHDNTLNVALSKVKRNMPDIPPFTIHDLRRTARTLMAELGISSHVAERCLNHKIRGVEGRYNTHDYLPERRVAMAMLAQVIEACEAGRDFTPVADNVLFIRANA